MNENDLLIKKNKILSLEEDVKLLEEKKKELNKLKKEYYSDYFDIDRSDYTLLTEIPKNPYARNPYNKKNMLHDYSILNVDCVGKMIAELINHYEHKNVIAERSFISELYETPIDRYWIKYPVLVIGCEKDIEDAKNRKNIVIQYEKFISLEKYPTDSPVWFYNPFSDPTKGTNYAPLLDYSDDLMFDYKKYEYVRELVCSLAYYQKNHDIKYMSSAKTNEIIKKIYKK